MRRLGLLLAFVACAPGSGTSTSDVDLETMSTTEVASTNPPVQTVTGETVDPDTTGATDPVTTTSATDTGTTTTVITTGNSSDESSSGHVEPVCGNGVVEGRESCDDGNDDETDGCTTECRIPGCGDAVIQPGEMCDDGNKSESDACLNNCTPASCGDGVVQAGKEDCDEGGANNDETGPCRTDCTLCDCQGDDLMGKTCGDFDFSCGSLACDGCGFDTSGCASPGVPNFQGKVGPAFNDGCWQQCEGYLDVNGGDDIPVAWGNDCAGVDFSRIRLACGTGLSSYRYITVEKNVFKDGLIGYPENGLISEAKDQNGNGFAIDNVIYAENNQPNTGRSWWNGGNGCDENSTNITFNNFCTYEASNCFGQNINGDRFVWVYVAP